jgi:hypothetical protein
MNEEMKLGIENSGHRHGLSDEDSEKYAKIIYLCLQRGDMHAVLLWCKQAIDLYYNKINVYSTDFGEETISSSTELPDGIINTLEKNGYIYWKDLRDAKPDDIINIRNIGITQYKRIVAELHRVIKRHTK